MPEVFATLSTPWQAGSAAWGSVLATPWLLGEQVWSTGGPYTPPPAPPGGQPTAPSLAARITIGAANSYSLEHTVQAVDLRDNTPLQLEQFSISADRDSMHWTLRASAGQAVFDKLQAGAQPARVRITIDGQAWEFVIESVARTRRFPSGDVAIEGRSLAAAAGTPYEPEKLWTVEGDTTAAQIAAVANLYTGLDVQWGIDDWLVPEGVFSFTGTPAGVVRRVADAAGAMALATRTGYGVVVRPRYALLPNEWPVTAPDLEVPLQLLEAEGFTVDSQPPYDGVVVAGQQRGVTGLVRLEGTTGAHQAPMVTDELITDLPAARQRGQAVLGRAGAQQIHTLTLPVPQPGGAGVVADPGWLLRVMDTPEAWVGLVTAVRLEVALPRVVQTLTVERHVDAVPGTVDVPPPESVLAFSGPIPALQVNTGAAVDVPLDSYWGGGELPYRYTLRSGVLPGWLQLNENTGRLVGTAPGTPGSSTIAVRATDAINSTADSNEFAVEVVSAAENIVISRFDGTDGQTAGVVNAGTAGGTWDLLNQQTTLSSVLAFNGPTSLRVGLSSGNSRVARLRMPGKTIAGNLPLMLEMRFLIDNLVVNPQDLVFTVFLSDWPVGNANPTSIAQIQFRHLSDQQGNSLGWHVAWTRGALIGSFFPVAQGVWHSIALSRDAVRSWRRFHNGVLLDGVVTRLTEPVITDPTLEVGVFNSLPRPWLYIDDLRWSVGQAFTSSYTPPANI